mmetsp:Transcript_77306/g.240936  ORF Transcript_77306/g.240936 Transcript_77306/m.240936 type:complete len:112 (+) Transcript_77306:223-558(+)
MRQQLSTLQLVVQLLLSAGPAPQQVDFWGDTVDIQSAGPVPLMGPTPSRMWAWQLAGQRAEGVGGTAVHLGRECTGRRPAAPQSGLPPRSVAALATTAWAPVRMARERLKS